MKEVMNKVSLRTREKLYMLIDHDAIDCSRDETRIINNCLLNDNISIKKFYKILDLIDKGNCPEVDKPENFTSWVESLISTL